MATRSRARMFNATARALRTAAEHRYDEDAGHVFAARVEDVVDDLHQIADIEVAAPNLTIAEASVDRDTLQQLHMEYRWAESKLMHASERLAEAEEARRKDLVALERMRRDLRSSFGTERAYVNGQIRLFADVLPRLQAREQELAQLVEAGARTAGVISDLAIIRAERRFYELAIAQATAQVARITDNESTLEYEVANEAFDLAPDGSSMRDAARLKAAQGRARRAAARARAEARELLETIGVDTSLGEITALSSFLAAEYEGDERAKARMDRLRARQLQLELSDLPEPTSVWKAGLRHPVSWFKARRATGA